MRRSGSRTMLLLGAVVAIGVALVIYLLLTNAGGTGRAQPAPTPIPEVVEVVAARTSLPAFTVLSEADLTTRTVAKSTVLTTTARSTLEVVGKMTTRPYQENEVISTAQSDLRNPGISRVIRQNFRAFGLAIQEINTFRQGLVENDNIDLLWSRKFETTTHVQPPTGGEPERIDRILVSTKTLLQNVKVLRVHSLLVGQQGDSGGPVNTTAQGSASDQQRQQQAIQAAFADDSPPTMVLILEVTDQQAEVIKFARENGRLDVALRAADDDGVERTTGITDKILVEDYGVVVPELIIR